MLLLYKEYQDFAYSRRVLDVAKNKDGVAGLGLILNFDGDKQRFSKASARPQATTRGQDGEKDVKYNMFRTVGSAGPSPFDKEAEA